MTNVGAHRTELVSVPDGKPVVVDVRSWAESRLVAGPRPRILVPTARQRVEVSEPSADR
ncbi:MAG: hypothetical protein M3Y36_09065 [Actinomycetota bacterium]|nr:hypothetical protein [Actinomycetota bacterium]